MFIHLDCRISLEPRFNQSINQACSQSVYKKHNMATYIFIYTRGREQLFNGERLLDGGAKLDELIIRRSEDVYCKKSRSSGDFSRYSPQDDLFPVKFCPRYLYYTTGGRILTVNTRMSWCVFAQGIFWGSRWDCFSFTRSSPPKNLSAGVNRHFVKH